MQVVLRIVTGDLIENRLLFPPGQYLFGRVQGAHVLFAPSSSASRRHCLLLVTETSASVRDLCSRNGTLVNQKRVIREQQLADGDLLSVGETTFRVELQLTNLNDSMAIEVTGKPLAETIDVPLAHTASETRLAK
jgi:pSer/pThr/pTyr-binding forkhead associated (FHA) protein